MNTCHNCQHEFESQPGTIQVCPLCGEPLELVPVTEDSVEADMLESSVFDEDDTVLEIDGNDQEEEFEIDHESAQPEETFIGTQDPEHQDDLILPKIPLAAANDETESVDSTPFAFTEQPTLDGKTDDVDEDEDFELSDDVAAPAQTEAGTEVAITESNDSAPEATEFYDADEKQPTIELSDEKFTASSLDYAEREIKGLSIDDQPGADADYVISMNEKDSQLGSGASGVVYKAVQKSLDRTVAIKLLKKQVKAGTETSSRKTTPKQKDVEKFLYESQITAGLDHPNVITVHDLGVTSNNTLFYSMKLFEGGRDWSKDFDKNNLEENLDIFNDVCDAMRRAHRDRIIHRDLKPQNVLVGDFGEVQVTDWGLAIDLNDEDNLQFSGGGTPCYMSPEMSNHFIAQQELRGLKTKLKWTQENAPNSSDEIQTLKEKIDEVKAKEVFYREQIGELSDVYVMGAILFQIAAGYPPHLFQVSDIHRKQWGSQTGKNKVRRELQMSADGKIANYLVRDLPNPEAREALRDIALKAMAVKMSDRPQGVDELQTAVRDFRDFMRCIEDTHRGDREVEISQEEQKSYVNLNNAIHAYEGALENYPDYKPANSGLAKARFLFAERALKNQDFELGLSTMTASAISQQPDTELASQLRHELITQRDRRDRRKKLLFLATMASLVAIGVGTFFGIAAFFANQQAQIAKAEATTATKEANQAKESAVESLDQVIQAKKDTIDLQVEKMIRKQKLDAIEKESKVSELQAELAKQEAKVAQDRAQLTSKRANITEKISETQQKFAKLETYKAQIDAEKIKQETQFGQYKNYLTEIERNIDEDLAKTSIRDLFASTDISLPVKNGWEIHHLYKQAHPAIAAVGQKQIGNIATLKSSADGNTMVALSTAGQLFQIDAQGQFTELAPDRIGDAKILSIDLSPNGKWLAVATEPLDDEEATQTARALPLVIDMKTGQDVPLHKSIGQQIRFRTLASKANSKSKKLCREKFFCRVQYVQFLDATDDTLELFMVDQRAQLGLNQIRCSVLDLGISNGFLAGTVKKTKLPGQLFLKNPGQLTETGCLASATYGDDGKVVAAIVASHPKYAVNVVSIDLANQTLDNPANIRRKDFEKRFLANIKSNTLNLDEIADDFAPTAIELIAQDNDRFQVLIGNGKGEIANLGFTQRSSNSVSLAMSGVDMLNPRSNTTESGFTVSEASRLTAKHKITNHRLELFASTHGARSRSKTQNRLPAHKTIVRDISLAGGQVISTSESEIMVWDVKGEVLVAGKKLFGHAGKNASTAITNDESQTVIYTASNLPRNLTEIRRWLPDSTNHDALIRRDNFKDSNRISKRITSGAADQNPGSQSVAFAFDDGTFEYFDPATGTKKLSRAADASLSPGENGLSRIDFNSGKFHYVENRKQLLMFSNSIGLFSWNLNNDSQTDPIRMQAGRRIFRGTPTTSSVFLAADETGQNLVTSHPNAADKLVLWQHTIDGQYSSSELGPFKKTGTESLTGLDVQVQPAISPNGEIIACVLRLRNTYEIQIFRTSPSRNLQKLQSFTGAPRTNFRSIQFLDDNEIIVTQDRVDFGNSKQTTNRIPNLMRIANLAGRWVDEIIDLPEFVTSKFSQISIADIAEFNGQRHYAGFAMSGNKKTTNATDQECETASGERRLIVFDKNRVIADRRVTFSRRIAPRFNNGQLQYLVAGTRGTSGKLVAESFNQGGAEEPVSFVVDRPDAKARSWHAIGGQRIIACGEDWFSLMNLNQNQPTEEFAFSQDNPATSLQLSGNKVLAHHEDNSISVIDTKTGKTTRGKGFFDSVALSPSGKFLAVAKENQVQLMATDRVDAVPMAKIDADSLCLSWTSKQSLANAGFAQRKWTDDILVVATQDTDKITLTFYDSSGNRLAVPASYCSLPLEIERDRQSVRSFSIAPVSGSMIGIVWNTDQADRADIWRYTKIEKGKPNAANNAPSKWFVVDDSNTGQIASVSFSEVSDDGADADSIATRLVISADNQGTKFIKLFALELGLRFTTKPLLDLYIADKLQKVDQIVGAEFSRDGKTLLTMTSQRAQIRLSDGWKVKKSDARFSEKINNFNSELSKLQAADLQSKLDSQGADLKELENEGSVQKAPNNRQKKLSKEIKAAQKDATEANEILNENEADIRKKLNAAARAEIDDLEKRIEELKAEIQQ